MAVKSVSRALDLLEALAVPEEIGLVELANRTGLQPSTAHRLLATLSERRYVVQDAATGRYLLGHKLNEVAVAVAMRTENLRELARPHLETIKKVTGESANLTVLELPNIVYVDQVEGSRNVRMFARIGAAVPAYATAAGKAMLAQMPPAVVRELYADVPLEPLTPRTIASIEELLAEFEDVRAQGFAVDREEQEPGVGCVAAAIRGHDTVIGALSVSAPMPRIDAADPAELGELLTVRADAVAAALGSELGLPR